jgi:hypothetical protein
MRRKKRRLTERGEVYKAVLDLTMASGWEVLTVQDYLTLSPEEIRQKKKEIKEAAEKALEELDL